MKLFHHLGVIAIYMCLILERDSALIWRENCMTVQETYELLRVSFRKIIALTNSTKLIKISPTETLFTGFAVFEKYL